MKNPFSEKDCQEAIIFDKYSGHNLDINPDTIREAWKRINTDPGLEKFRPVFILFKIEFINPRLYVDGLPARWSTINNREKDNVDQLMALMMEVFPAK